MFIQNFNLFEKFLNPLKISHRSHIEYTHYTDIGELIKLIYDADYSTKYLLSQTNITLNRYSFIKI